MGATGLAISAIQNNATSSTPDTSGIGAGGYGAIATIGTTAIQVWADISLANQQRQMSNDLAQYNNSMRGVVQGMKQYAADRNRSAANDSRISESMQIELDRMRSEAEIQTQGAFIGASSGAKRAAMFDIDRNAVVAKFNSASQFEHALQQIQLSEYSDEVGQINASQNTDTPRVGIAGVVAQAGLGLVQQSLKSGSMDKGSAGRTYFSNLFNNSSTTIPD